jgi:hypothetical protein
MLSLKYYINLNKIVRNNDTISNIEIESLIKAIENLSSTEKFYLDLRYVRDYLFLGIQMLKQN